MLAIVNASTSQQYQALAMNTKRVNVHHSENCVLWVKVTPKASCNEIIGWEGEFLKVRLKAVPEKGKANQELIYFLAHCFAIQRERIQLLSGASSRKKKLCLIGFSLEEMHKRIVECMRIRGS